MRNREISFVNVVLCLLVMWIHICSVAVTGLPKENISFFGVYVPWRLSAFVVQGFIFLSALKYFRKEGAFSYGSFLWGRIRKIGVPYVIAVIISYLGLIDLGYYTFDAGFLGESLLLGNMIAPFYFIIIIFQFYILMPLWRKMTEKVDFWVAVLASVMLMRLFHGGLPAMIGMISPGTEFIYNDRVFTSYLAYWVLGCYAGKYYDRFLEGIRKNQGVLLTGFVIFVLTDGLLSYANNRGFFRVSFLEDVHTLYVFCAILFLFWIGKKVADRVMAWKVVQGIDRMSFYLYLYHGIFLYYVQDAFLNRFGVGPAKGLLLRAVCCYGMTAVVGLLAWYWKKRKGKQNP